MSRPRLLDLFCGAGGAAMGYHRAGFDVTGVDNKPQPRYPFEFIQADALTFPLDGYDAIHASPPCQAYTALAALYPTRKYSDLVSPVRNRLRASQTPFVIENVPGAPMRPDIVLCGSMFGLRVRRHRWFEFSKPRLDLIQPCAHVGEPVGVYGHTGGEEKRHAARGMKRFPVDVWREAMGIDWMTAAELSQAIPPAYTEWIGQQLLAQLQEKADQIA